MAKLPALQFYPGDWRKDPCVQALDFELRGIWFELLLLMHESEHRGYLLLNGKSMPSEALANVLGLDRQKVSKCLATLVDYGVASRCERTGALYCRRMVRDEEIRQTRAECGRLGGNPKLLQAKSNQGVKVEVKQRANQNTEDEDSPSLSLSSRDVEVQERKGARRSNAPPDDWAGLPAELDCEPFKQEWTAYLASRRENGHKPLGRTNVLTKWKTLAGHGARLAIAIVRKSTEEGWAGFFPEQVSLADADKVAASNKPPPDAPIPEPSFDWRKAATRSGEWPGKDWRAVKWRDLDLYRDIQEAIMRMEIVERAHN